MEPFGTACDHASCPAPWFWHLCHGLMCSNWFLTHSHELQKDNGYSLWPHCARYPLCTTHTWSRAAVHWQDWRCKLLQMLLALKPMWVPAYACQCPAASHHLLQIAFRLSQKDSCFPYVQQQGFGNKSSLLFGAGCLDWEIQLKASCKLSRKWWISSLTHLQNQYITQGAERNLAALPISPLHLRAYWLKK